jgi:hypothetical protein
VLRRFFEATGKQIMAHYITNPLLLRAIEEMILMPQVRQKRDAVQLELDLQPPVRLIILVMIRVERRPQAA